jgi:hypothetical protein
VHRRIQSALNVVGDSLGWNNVPPEFKNLNCAQAIAQGEPTVTLALLQFLHDVAAQRNNTSGSFDADSDVERAVMDIQSTRTGKMESTGHSEPDEQYLAFEPVANVAGASRPNAHSSGDRLDEELHVLPRETQSRSRSRIATDAPKSSTERAERKGSVKPAARSKTPPLILQHRRTADKATKARESGSQNSPHASLPGGGAAKLVTIKQTSSRNESSATATKTGLVKRKHATHPMRRAAGAVPASTEPATATTAARKQHTAPTGVTVRAGRGLSLGKGLVDPRYKAGPRSRFAETVEPPPPAPESSSDSSTDDGIRRPTYDHLFDRNPRVTSRMRDLRDKALLNARLPHSRSVSPVGRRHIHCQLHGASETIGPVAVDRFGKAIDPIIDGPSQMAPGPHPASELNDSHYHQRRAREGRSHSPNGIRARQAEQVLGVFRKQSQDLQKQQRRGSGQRATADIDSAVDTDRKNTILEWIQRQLGVTVDVLLNATTSHHYNVTAGRKLTLSDGINVTKRVQVPGQLTSTGGGPGANASNAKRHKRRSSGGGEYGDIPDAVDKENYPFYPVPEDVLYFPGRTPELPGSYSIASYLGRLTQGMPAYANNAAVQVVAQQLPAQQQHQQLLQIPPQGPYVRPFVPPTGKFPSQHLCRAPAPLLCYMFVLDVDHNTPVTSVGFLNDPWVNGVLLSQVVAALFVENRALIKQVRGYLEVPVLCARFVRWWHNV